MNYDREANKDFFPYWDLSCPLEMVRYSASHAGDMERANEAVQLLFKQSSLSYIEGRQELIVSIMRWRGWMKRCSIVMRNTMKQRRRMYEVVMVSVAPVIVLTPTMVYIHHLTRLGFG